MNNGIFIAGTDTNIGKTRISGFLLKFLLQNKINAITQKWIQTGSLKPIDILKHYVISEKKIDKSLIKYQSPYIFKFAASPHLSASLENKKIEINKIINSYNYLNKTHDVVIVEGSGGLLVPINQNKTILDIVQKLKLDIILVVENKLGAINHTLLSINEIKNRGLNLLGLIFNNLSKNNLILKDNPIIIKLLSKINILGTLPYNKSEKLNYKNFLDIANRIIKTKRT